MPRTTDDPKVRKLEMRVSDAFLGLIDRWRGKQTDRPSRSEAVRRIVEHTLKEKL